MAQGIVGEFQTLKADSDAELLAMQCGDFYEFFDDDAECVADELDLTTSTKSSGGESYPMAGVPVSELQPYLNALVERGYTVAVAEQFEDESGDFYREITRRVTPGTLIETTDSDAQYLAAVVADEAKGPYGVAFADITTGQFLVTEVETSEDVQAECYRFDPAELLAGPTVRTDDAFLNTVTDRETEVTLHSTDAFAPGRATHAVSEQFGSETLDSIGLDSELAIQAAGAVLHYVFDTGVGVKESITRLQSYTADDHVRVDSTTQRNLELIETMHGDSEGSLVATLDHTVTAPGGRLLREWVTRPRRDRETLDRRLESVAALAATPLHRQRLQETLETASDLERLASRVASGSAGAAELLAIRETLGLLPKLAEQITGELGSSPIPEVLETIDREAAADLHQKLDTALAAEPPKTVTQGGVFARGYHEELDALIEKEEEATAWIDGLADRVAREYGLTHVSVGRNKTDGYYIQVGQSEADDVPAEFSHIKTLKNSKRFVTDELAEREREILRVEQQRGELEYELFETLREQVAEQSALLQSVGRAVARLDGYCSLATHAAANDWCRPTLADPGRLAIEAGRHPVVEQTTEFVPNDLHLDAERGFLLVTGPNMSGKSTYMRQAALITLLAQIGSFVPAKSATVGVVDGIYTRVGALDELAEGRSTFMVEMQELSNILHSATEESLVILDEVGRGTATYDGISIAWAATEYIHNRIGCHCLFATHYHELTSLASHLDRVGNVHIAVANAAETDGEDITFLRTVEKGATDRSYGIHVADLAGVPEPVVGRAREVLDKLRAEKAIEAKGSGSEPTQAVFDLSSGTFQQAEEKPATAADSLADGTKAAKTTGSGDNQQGSTNKQGASTGKQRDPDVESVVSAIQATDINETPPVELMAKVQEWQQRLSETDAAPE